MTVSVELNNGPTTGHSAYAVPCQSARATVYAVYARGRCTAGATRGVSAITVKRDHALLMHNELPLPAGPAAGGVTHAATSAKRKHSTTVCEDF